MKKTLFLLTLAATTWANAQKPLKVEGIIENEPDIKEVKIEISKGGPNGELQPAESVEVKKGKFKYTTTINEVTQAVITRGEGENAKSVTAYMIPGETLKLTIKGDEFFYNGSKIYKECNDADMAITPKYQDFMNYYRAAVARVSALPEDQQQAVAEKINDTLRIKNQAYSDAIENYAASHKNVEGALLYLSSYLDAEKTYSEMSEEMKTGRIGQYYKALVDYIAKMREEQAKQAAEEQARLDAMKGKAAKDFTLNDLDGNPLALSSLRGKYVVLDFWGSWCGWCIKGIPDMKKYYEKYSGKFEILGIDCNDSDKAWRDAVKKYELPWKHVYNPRESTVLSDYNIQGFPTKIVIDPQGNLDKIIVGEDPAFYEYLDEILSK